MSCGWGMKKMSHNTVPIHPQNPLDGLFNLGFELGHMVPSIEERKRKGHWVVSEISAGLVVLLF